MIAVKELTWQLASGWGRYFGCGISNRYYLSIYAVILTREEWQASPLEPKYRQAPPLKPTKSKSAKRPSWISFDKHLWSQIKWSADQDNFVRSDQRLSRESLKKSKIRSIVPVHYCCFNSSQRNFLVFFGTFQFVIDVYCNIIANVIHRFTCFQSLKSSFVVANIKDWLFLELHFEHVQVLLGDPGSEDECRNRPNGGI